MLITSVVLFALAVIFGAIAALMYIWSKPQIALTAACLSLCMLVLYCNAANTFASNITGWTII